MNVAAKCEKCGSDDVWWWNSDPPRVTADTVILEMECGCGHVTDVTVILVPVCGRCRQEPAQEGSHLCKQCTTFLFPESDRREYH